MNFRDFVEKAPDAELLREMIGFAAERLMELEVGAVTGAAYGEKDHRVAGLLLDLGRRRVARDGLVHGVVEDFRGEVVCARVSVLPGCIPGRFRSGSNPPRTSILFATELGDCRTSAAISWLPRA